METSTCSACNRTLPLDAFYWQKGKERAHAWCKECYRDWHRRRYTPKVPVAEVATCVVCGAEYAPKQRRPTKYCSQECRNQSRIGTERALRKARTEGRSCEWCGKGLTFVPGRRGRVRFCSTACQRKARHARLVPAERAAYRFLQKYGITLEQRSALLKKQGGGCAICGTKHPGSKGWALDHDHACCPTSGRDVKTCGKCIRGVLCGRCNLAIGLFDDDPSRLRVAANYLKYKRKK